MEAASSTGLIFSSLFAAGITMAMFGVLLYFVLLLVKLVKRATTALEVYIENNNTYKTNK